MSVIVHWKKYTFAHRTPFFVCVFQHTTKVLKSFHKDFFFHFADIGKRSPRFRPRPYLLLGKCPNGMRKNPRCCGGKWIDNPFVKTCCRDRIISTSLAPFCKRLSKCGRYSMYNRKHQRCCNDQVIPRSVKCKRLRCKRERYYTFNEQCCNGKVIPKHVPCNPFPTQCGGISYDPTFQKCCSTRVVPRHILCLSGVPCGHTFYNPQLQQCCNGRVIPKYVPCNQFPVPCGDSPHCCGGKLIDDPSTKTCCRNRIISTSLAPFCKKMSKCGRHSLYNRKYQRCCNDQVIPRNVKCKRLRCKRERYYTFNEQCCNGKVIPKHVPCSPFPTQCGGISYDPTFQKCCFTRVVSIHIPCPAGVPCGHAFYDPRRQQCCNGQVLPRFTPCIPFKCGGHNYNPNTQQCCNGQIFPRFQRCPAPGPHHQFCGSNVINPSSQRCCYGNAVAPLGSTCQKCGASLYLPFGFRCCHGTQVVPRFVRCAVFG